jgi:predicted RNA binding protein YcfA (HicA-like mRNA interferase family)
MTVPRQVSSQRFIRHLERNWGYQFSRQKGSHIIVTTSTPMRHSLPVPQRAAIGPGLLHSLLKQVATAKATSVDAIAEGL